MSVIGKERLGCRLDKRGGGWVQGTSSWSAGGYKLEDCIMRESREFVKGGA